MAEIWDWSETPEKHPEAVGYISSWGGSNWDSSDPEIHPPTPEGRDSAFSIAEDYAVDFLQEWISEQGFDENDYDPCDNPAESHASAVPIFIDADGSSFACVLCKCCDWSNHKPKIRLVRISEGQK